MNGVPNFEKGLLSVCVCVYCNNVCTLYNHAPNGPFRWRSQYRNNIFKNGVSDIVARGADSLNESCCRDDFFLFS